VKFNENREKIWRAKEKLRNSKGKTEEERDELEKKGERVFSRLCGCEPEWTLKEPILGKNLIREGGRRKRINYTRQNIKQSRNSKGLPC